MQIFDQAISDGRAGNKNQSRDRRIRDDVDSRSTLGVGGRDRRSQSFLEARISKGPGASAANAADRAFSIHQMKSHTKEPSNNRPTLLNVGRRNVVSFARRLTRKINAASFADLVNMVASLGLAAPSKR